MKSLTRRGSPFPGNSIPPSRRNYVLTQITTTYARIARRRTQQRPALDGHWQGTVSGPNGDFTINFTFKADGAKLTGSVETPNGEQPISDGKIEGDKLSFNTKFQDNVIEHEGTISGDTIQLKVKGPWGESEMTLKRVAEKKSEK